MPRTTKTTKAPKAASKAAKAPKKAAPKKAAPKKAAPKKAAPKKAAPKKAAKASKPARTRRIVRKTGNPEFQNFEPYKPRRGEKYMNEPQRDHFKGILLDWKSELMQEVDRTVSHMKDEAANFPDPADRATQEEEYSL
jgi:DnaK suppressor protein